MPADDVLPQTANAYESTDLPEKHGCIRRMLEIMLEAANPFEVVFELFSDHGAVAGLVILIAAVAVSILLITGFWSVVQETFVGGGPSQSLGLK